MAELSKIEVTGPFPAEIEFARLEGADEISRSYRYDLWLVLPTGAGSPAALDPATVLGQPVAVAVDTAVGTRHFHGIVDEFGVTGITAKAVIYTLTLRPWLWFLSKAADNRIFQEMSVVQIVEEVFSAYSEARFEKRLTGTYPTREYCVQYGESDLDFVQRLLEHEGIFYHFEQTGDTHTLILTDAVSELAPVADYEKVPFRPAGQVSLGSEAIREWRRISRVVQKAVAQTDYDFEKPSADLMSLSEKPLGSTLGDREVYAYPGRYIVTSQGDALSNIRREELQVPAHTVDAEGDAFGLAAGAIFDLVEHAIEAENMTYTVLRAEHRVSNAQRDPAAGDTGLSGTLSLRLMPKAAPFRPARTTPKPVMKGPQTAMVVGPGGEEIFTDEYARVKVQFHWDRKGARDEDSSCFVRVSSAWAGAGWGFIQIPRIGQEVIVDFLEGDPDQPIITGRVYNAEQMPPYGLPGSATQSGWKSNSTPGGGGWNELRFEDKKGSEEVYFQAEKDHNELVKNNETRTIGNDWVEDVGHDATQSVANDRTESVGNDKSTTVGKNRTVSIGLNDTEQVGKDRELAVGGDETIHVVGSSKEEIDMNNFQTIGLAQKILVKAGRQKQVGLAELVSVGGLQSITVGKKRDIKVGSNQSHFVEADDSYTVKGDQTVVVQKSQTVTITENQSITTDGGRIIKVKKGQTHDVGEDVWMKAGKAMMIEAADSIVIQCGSAAISMKKDGTINIEGKDITLNGSGKINVKASSDVTVKGSKINQN